MVRLGDPEGEALAALDEVVDPLGLLLLGAVLDHQDQAHLVADDGVFVLQVVVQPEALGREVLADDRHAEVVAVAAAVLLGERPTVEARCVGHPLDLVQQLLPLLVGQPATLPVGACILPAVVEEADVVVLLLERLDLLLDEVVQLRQQVGDVVGDVEVHRGIVAWRAGPEPIGRGRATRKRRQAQVGVATVVPDVPTPARAPMTSLARMHTVVVPGGHLMAALLGQRDANLRQIEAAFPDASVAVRGNEVSVDGAQADVVAKLIEELVVLVQRGQDLDESSVRRSIDMVLADERPSNVLTDDIMRGAKGKPVRPKTAGQKRYIDTIRENVITFGLGPAGTGKSWLAVAHGRARAAEQAGAADHPHAPGRRGGRAARVPPGRPDGQGRPVPAPALRRALRHGRAGRVAAKLLRAWQGSIEVAPLAYMRGRTLNDAASSSSTRRRTRRPSR